MRVLYCFTLIVIISSYGFSQKVSNVSHELEGDNIIISYDLEGDADANYNVSVVLRREEYSGFQIIPKSVSGDIGEGKFVGKQRKIVWDVSKDYRIDPEVSDYYFEVKATIVSGGIPWYYFAGGAVLGGGAAALLLLKPQETNSSVRVPIGSPPLRP